MKWCRELMVGCRRRNRRRRRRRRYDHFGDDDNAVSLLSMGSMRPLWPFRHPFPCYGNVHDRRTLRGKTQVVPIVVLEMTFTIRHQQLQLPWTV